MVYVGSRAVRWIWAHRYGNRMALCPLRHLVSFLLLCTFHSRNCSGVQPGVQRDSTAESLEFSRLGDPFIYFFCFRLHESSVRPERRRRSLSCVTASTRVRGAGHQTIWLPWLGVGA